MLQALCSEGKASKQLPLTAKVGGGRGARGHGRGHWRQEWRVWRMGAWASGLVLWACLQPGQNQSHPPACLHPLLPQVPMVKRTVEKFVFHIKAFLTGAPVLQTGHASRAA